jgi:hypothetical protein
MPPGRKPRLGIEVARRQAIEVRASFSAEIRRVEEPCGARPE